MTPDLTILGKVLGGGLPLAAVSGRRGLMERLAPVGETYQAGTLSGNPLATAAGLATLGRLDAAAYAGLGQTTDRLAEGLRGDGVKVSSETGLLTVFFAGQPVTDYRAARAADHDAFARFWTAMLERGIYLPPSPYRGVVSLARPHRRAHRTHDRGGARVVRDRGRGVRETMLSGHTMARLREIVVRGGRGHRARAVAARRRTTRSARWSRPPPRTARTRSSTRSWWRACWRATSCTAAARGCSTPPTRTCACSPATTCTRSA